MSKKIVLIFSIVMSILILSGCESKEDIYKKDRENLRKIIRLNDLMEDKYREAKSIDNIGTTDTIDKFSNFCDTVLEEAKKVKIKTEEGKEYKDLSIERIEYLKEYLINNWGDTNKYFEYDEELGKIDAELGKLGGKFLTKKEEAVFGDS